MTEHNTASRREALTRRHFLAGSAALASTAIAPSPAWSNPIALAATSRILEVKGKAAKVYGLIDTAGRHGINMVLAPRFSVSIKNDLAEETLIHWHGLTPPPAMDGTPMLSGPTIRPGETRPYDFANREAGTHWMHSHVGLQEQHLLAAPLIIRETETPLFDEQEHVVMLHDFTFRDPKDILAELQAGSGAHAGHAMPASSMPASSMPGMLSDIAYDALLANDRTLDDPEIVGVERMGRLRLRLINACAASNLWIDLGALSGEIIAVDGKSIHAVGGSRFPLAIAQRADIRLQLPPGPGAWPILFRSEGSTLQGGIILRQGKGAVARLSDQGEVQPALDLSLEGRLRSVAVPPEIAVSRSEIVRLTGGGADYLWGLNDKYSLHDTIMTVREGERYEMILRNDTTMSHPMHLHGHYFKVVEINGQRINGAIRDTVLVPPDNVITIQFDANNPGTWAFHCHHLYHMNSGMMGALAYASAA